MNTKIDNNNDNIEFQKQNEIKIKQETNNDQTIQSINTNWNRYVIKDNLDMHIYVHIYENEENNKLCFNL